ncbi:hypothetical protein DGWBC_0663 [Dehalogenimonas sp. WBC-2]|nr:hypothetical protein DGWBC_0663 [Dehalogenimonas sp. WBC-2]
MAKEWVELTKLTGGQTIVVERVRLPESGIAIEGEFILPSLAQLSGDDQVFIMAFVGAHGSIKDMERFFGISYPTVKNRLDKLASQLKMVEMVPLSLNESNEDVLGLLEKGEINADEALRRMGK